MTKQQLTTLNNLLEEAVYHGGDCGGAYYSNPEDYSQKAIQSAEAHSG